MATKGSRAELFLSLPPSTEDLDLTLVFDPCSEGYPQAPQAIVSSAPGDGIELPSELVRYGRKLGWEIRMASAAWPEGTVTLELAVGDGSEPLHLRAIALRHRNRRLRQAVRSLSHRRSGRTTPRH